jgi:hypothetical protein
MHENGKNDQDRIADAIKDFKLKMEGKEFRFPHYIEILWECPQFNASRQISAGSSLLWVPMEAGAS